MDWRELERSLTCGIVANRPRTAGILRAYIEQGEGRKEEARCRKQRGVLHICGPLLRLLVVARTLEKDIFKQLWIGKHNTALYSFQTQRVTTGGKRPPQEREQANGATS
jgi:hypothetical protein